MLIFIQLTGCRVGQSFSPSPTPTVMLTPTLTSTVTPTPTVTPTATEQPFYVSATYFSGELQVPILIYHQFFPDAYGPTDATRMQLSEFQNELQTFYDEGFSLISLRSWIDGTFVVPAGRKPLVLTIDDGWYGDQLFIQEDGTPSELSGIGLLWKFSQEHPDFGFHVAVFAVMGDHYYSDKQVGDRFLISDGQDWFSSQWRQKLGNTIVWALEHGVEVYNHTLLHPNLGTISNTEIQRQLWENDWVVRDLLEEVGRKDLIPQLENVIALPEGRWPSTESGKRVLFNYKNPEKKAVLAIMEAYNLDGAQFTPSFFSPGFDPLAIPRITASPSMTNYIIENKDLIPTALTCQLGPLEIDQVQDPELLRSLIQAAIASGGCTEGVYHVEGQIFRAEDGQVEFVSSDAGMTPTASP